MLEVKIGLKILGNVKNTIIYLCFNNKFLILPPFWKMVDGFYKSDVILLS